MKMKKLLSAFLTLVMVIGSVGVAGYAASFDSYAANDTAADEEGAPTINYLGDAFKSEEAKLKTMTLVREQDGYQLYYEDVTGEIAFRNIETGETLFSNPYDVADNSVNRGSTATRKKLMSQLAVTYESNNVEGTMYSYEEAALRGQIVRKNIKNGIRVEYTIGELATTRLVPRMISKTRFETMIMAKIVDEASLTRLMSFYRLYDTSDKSYTERQIMEIQASFPITKQFAIYVCTPDIAVKELQTCEKIIKTYCPNYTYEEMDQDHSDCNYVVSDQAPPNFKMAIEYTISENGLEARLPANGIRFDESNYMLKTVTLLPYMGAGRSVNTGYTFIPDGSGTLIRFEDLGGKSYNVSGQMYGIDYAYHSITGQHSEIMRAPVFGVVEDIKEYKQSDADVGQMVETGETTPRGYFAVITEGDSMATLFCENGGQVHGYNNVYAKFDPRPSDIYSLSSTVSASGNSASAASVRKTSDRKYTGSYRVQYTLLSGDKEAVESGKLYNASYVGMANVYRDYLASTNQIAKLDESSVKNDIPLYLETLGTDYFTDTFLSVPVMVNLPLTTFEHVRTIYDELADAGISNINFKLNGYANNGIFSTYPAKLRIEKEVGGSKGFEELLEYAKDKDFGLYPEFDLVNVRSMERFGGVSMKRDFAKSIDDRYMGKREYDAALQKFVSTGGALISSSRFEYFTEKLEKSLSKYDDKGLSGISLSTFGTDLNSDFDEDDPYNREDSKQFTVNSLASMKEKYSVMVEGGNSYTLPYADHIIALPTESSNFLNASESVPFMAMVLHGYKNYTGSAINMQGDITNAVLKCIENGASPYFILCYENTSYLKYYDTSSKYYSVAYDVWKDDIIKYYDEINEALGDLQTSVIVDHDYIDAYRIVANENETLTEDQIKAKEEAELLRQQNAEREEKRNQLLASRGETPNAAGSSSGSGAGDRDKNTDIIVATESGSVVRVEYDNGVNFIINYNSFDVNVWYQGKTIEVPALDFIRVEAN